MRSRAPGQQWGHTTHTHTHTQHTHTHTTHTTHTHTHTTHTHTHTHTYTHTDRYKQNTCKGRVQARSVTHTHTHTHDKRDKQAAVKAFWVLKSTAPVRTFLLPARQDQDNGQTIAQTHCGGILNLEAVPMTHTRARVRIENRETRTEQRKAVGETPQELQSSPRSLSVWQRGYNASAMVLMEVDVHQSVPSFRPQLIHGGVVFNTAQAMQTNTGTISAGCFHPTTHTHTHKFYRLARGLSR